MLIHLAKRREASTMPPPALPEPGALFSARTSRQPVDTSNSANSLAADADLHRQEASNMRLTVAKPTTQTTAKKFSNLSADTYKGTKSHIAHFQKTQASIGTNVTIIGSLYRDREGANSPQKVCHALKLNRNAVLLTRSCIQYCRPPQSNIRRHLPPRNLP